MPECLGNITSPQPGTADSLSQTKQAREIEQESGTQMRGIMSGRGFVDYS